ncbi:MAG: hypothetical protein NT118_11520 [Lentisphaerae bacterium]|nr:hypothetical protein [Lentisphaerota bacterium]
MHKISIKHPVLIPEDGLLLGNGDVSVSIFQRHSQIIFRFGKGDVWDTRIRLDQNPQPAHISELREALESQEITCKALGADVHGKAITPRLKEICRPTPTMNNYPYPCPKPVCELVLHYPGDLKEMKISQTLFIEKGRAELELTWQNGTALKITAVIHPEINRLALKFKITGMTPESRYGGTFYGLPEPFPVYFSLYRDGDPDISAKHIRRYRVCRHNFLAGFDPKVVKPLPPPEYVMLGDTAVMHQRFPEDNRFANGFEYCIAATGTSGFNSVIENSTIFLLPKDISTVQGELSVGLSSTPETAEDAIRIAEYNNFESDCKAAAKAALEFWKKSSFSCKDKFFENLWYSNLHAKRAVLKAGKTPPGLFLPSTLEDFSLWHGDYHLNYNYQALFLGDFEANHIETADAFFTGIAGAFRLGHKIARDYYSCRGVFMQLAAFPFSPEDDYMGGLPFGRMAYMTGWIAAYFYRRWRYTLDKQWLKETGYPALKEFALFYMDFLTLGDDGYYHAYPSNQGEADFSKKNCFDQPQVMCHVRYTLYCAAETAKCLEVDAELCAQWQKIISKLLYGAGSNSNIIPLELPGEYCGDGNSTQHPCELTVPGQYIYDWYCGHLHYYIASALRSRTWSAERDFPPLRKTLERWREPNGLLTAMSRVNYGNPGAWSESLAVVGVISDMLLQSWSGIIEVFPGWPRNIDAKIKTLRAEGAFLISSELRNGQILKIEVLAEKANLCRMKNPWKPGIIEFNAARGQHVVFYPSSTEGI